MSGPKRRGLSNYDASELIVNSKPELPLYVSLDRASYSNAIKAE